MIGRTRFSPSLRVAVERRLVADVPVGCLLSGGVDSSLIVGLLAEAGQHGLATFSIGFESVGGVKGDEFRYSDIIAERFEHRPPPDPHRHRPDAARTRRCDRRHERADGQPRLRRLLSAQPGSGQARQGRAVRAGRRRGVRRLPLVSPDGQARRRIARGLGGQLPQGVLRPGPVARGVAALVDAGADHRRGGPERTVRHRALRARRRRRPASTARCGWTPP